jgi:uncharacterized protein (TIGR02996 family)
MAQPKPSDHVIVSARDEVDCATCGALIPEGELALGEAYVSTDGKWARSHRYARTERKTEYHDDDHRHQDSINADLSLRLHHLMCGAKHQPYKLRTALKTSADPIPNREALVQAIADALSPRDQAETVPATREKYAQFIARLRETSDDDDFLVFGDWLQSIGDPRGELIAVQHKLETAVNEDRAKLLDHEHKLITQFTPEPPVGTLKWRRGFVHKIYNATGVTTKNSPSLRFLQPGDISRDREPEAPLEPLVKPAGPKKATGDWRVRHTRKPEWGIGLVISEDEETGREVKFEHAGVKRVKNIELLEDLVDDE